MNKGRIELAYRKESKVATREATPVKMMVTVVSLVPVPPVIATNMMAEVQPRFHEGDKLWTVAVCHDEGGS